MTKSKAAVDKMEILILQGLRGFVIRNLMEKLLLQFLGIAKGYRDWFSE